MYFITTLFKGMVIGVANIIPGVSGGTLALVLGIYERLISAIHNISFQTLARGLGLLRFQAESWRRLQEELRRIDAGFLTLIGLGAVAAIVALANVMTYLLERQHDPTYGFFFGLVAISAWVPWQLIRRKTWPKVLIGLLAAGLVVWLAAGLGGERQLEQEQTKYELKMESAAAPGAGRTGRAPNHGPAHLLGVFIAGGVAISAMILPGVSGSFLLLLLGVYFEILKAIVLRDMLVLGVFVAGCGVGILLFSRLLNWLLRKWHDETMSFLLGLVLGSLWAIWPFKTTARVGAEIIYLSNRAPGAWGANEFLTLAAAVAGGLVVAGFIWLERPGGWSVFSKRWRRKT